MPRPTDRVRRGVRVRGVVQGVGFRPAAYRLAVRAKLSGYVRNDSDGVWIEVEGPLSDAERFIRALRDEAPPLCRIASVDVRELSPTDETGFRIDGSQSGAAAGSLLIPVDSATCDACLRELFDPHDRRYRYPFINCTDCGPRFTIAREVPWDRQRTTMATFPLCIACRAEYEDPSSRRFHAEPIACADCGPRFVLAGDESGRDAVERAAERLRDGAILAVKGIGGFHLAVDARNDAAVLRLRERKQRADRPLALMARDLDTVRQIAAVAEAAREALTGPARPIVLLPLHTTRGFEAIAPRLDEVGVMLPYAPIHHLLLDASLPLLVMTSGNRTSDPISIENDDAIEHLAGIADHFLIHDRPIARRADDSVVRIVSGGAQPLRRARGLVPEPVALPFETPDLVATGAETKSTICVVRNGAAWLSPHIGDLSTPATRDAFETTIRELSQLIGAQPVAVAHDLHPDYHSTRWAVASRLRTIGVQHHHAHIASCLAEHGRSGPVIGVAFDGTGCGPAGELWGGEFLLADLNGFRRAGHLSSIALPGGEAAIRQPWRLAVAALKGAGEELDLMDRIPSNQRKLVEQMILGRTRTILTSSAGRWFDAVASLCGVRDEVTFDAQAAMELEALAGAGGAPFPFEIHSPRAEEPFVVRLDETVRTIAAELRRGAAAAGVASRFHETMASIVADGVEAACRSAEGQSVFGHENPPVALSGGCFQNRLLTERAKDLLERRGFEVLIHRRVPPNDGGVALGQAAVAASRLDRQKER